MACVNNLGRQLVGMLCSQGLETSGDTDDFLAPGPLLLRPAWGAEYPASSRYEFNSFPVNEGDFCLWFVGGTKMGESRQISENLVSTLPMVGTWCSDRAK